MVLDMDPTWGACFHPRAAEVLEPPTRLFLPDGISKLVALSRNLWWWQAFAGIVRPPALAYEDEHHAGPRIVGANLARQFHAETKL